MAQGATLQVEGLTSVLRGFHQADRDAKKLMYGELREIGNVVKRDAALFLSPVSSHSAAGFKTRVRQRGVAVEQSLRKTSGAHPEWGSYQMKHALLPALMRREDDTERAMEQAMDKMAVNFNRGG